MDVPRVEVSIPVVGGSLLAGRWGTGAEIVVASHGITANHRSWDRVAPLVVERSGGAVSVLAVDHRGRAGSASVPGPFGLAAHGDDIVAVLDQFDVADAVLVGHSMGGFVVTAAAERHPDRVRRLVLVDGGVPFPMERPAEVDVEEAVRAVIGPALDRLDLRWPDEESYVDFFRAHPAFQPPNRWWPAVEAYVRHDAVATDDGQVRSSVSKEAVLVDGGAAIVDPRSAAAVERISQPSHLLWAPRGILDQEPGIYHQEQVESVTSSLDHLTAHLVADTNHYTIAVGDHGAAAVADAVVAATTV